MGRDDDLRRPACDPSGRSPSEPSGSGPSACCSRGRRTDEVRAFANTCRHRGHELLPDGDTADRASVICPYHAWSYDLGRRRARHAAAARPGRPRARAGRAAGATLARLGLRACRDGAGPLRRPVLRRPPRRRWPASSSRTRLSALVRLAQALVRGGRELEGDHRELPRVLPLPADPPRAVPGQPAGLGRELRPAGHVGRRVDGAARRHDDDVVDGGVRGSADPGRAAGPGRVSRAPPQPADLAAPRLRDDAPHGAAAPRTGP